MNQAQEEQFNEMIRTANRFAKNGADDIAMMIRRWANEFRETASSKNNLLNTNQGLRAQVTELILDVHTQVGRGAHAQCKKCCVPYPCPERRSVWR